MINDNNNNIVKKHETFLTSFVTHYRIKYKKNELILEKSYNLVKYLLMNVFHKYPNNKFSQKIFISHE